jgi:tetratricopeptide (TPR) repeat protein
MLRLRVPMKLASTSLIASVLTAQQRYVGPRQYAPKGYRDAAGRLPMTPEFGEECNELAKVAHQSKNFGDAIALYDRALSMRREVNGPIDLQCAATLHNIGRCFIDMKEYGAAENALTEAAAIYEELEGPQSLKYAESLALLAHAYAHLKMLDESEKAFKDAIRVYRDALYNHKDNTWLPEVREAIKEPNLHPLSSVAYALADCATLFLIRGWEHRAIQFIEEALEIRRYLYSRHQKFRPMIAQTLNKLAELKKAINDATGAEMAISECIEICISTMGKDSAATAHAISTKASLLAGKKQFREALKLYEESTTTYGIALGKDHPIFAQEVIKLGRAQEFIEDFASAEKSYRKGLELLQKVTGEDSLQVAEAAMCLGTLLIRKLDIDNGVDHLRNAVKIRKAKNRDDPQLAFMYQKLGEAYAMKQEHHAEAYFLMAIDRFRENAKIEQLQKTYMTDVLDDLGLYYLEFKHLDKAENCFKESLDTRIELLGENHATVAYSYSNFALLYLQKEDYKSCEKMCETAIEMYLKTAKSNVVAHADVYTTHGQCMQLQKKFLEALKLHEKALNIRRTRGDSLETATAESLNYIARVYIGLKDYPKALKHVAEAKRIALRYSPEVTRSLRVEIDATEQRIPSMDTWTQEIEGAVAAPPQPAAA